MKSERMKVTEMEIKRDRYGRPHIEMREVEKDYEIRATGRHRFLCNLCGFSTYPKCREWCPKGKEEKE